MITEDFVSLEVAKLLKEKGFSEPVHYEYHYTISVPQFHKKAHNFNGEEYANCETEWFSAPTIQRAMKWFREVHNLWCEISPEGKGLWYREVYSLTDEEYIPNSNAHKIKSYEEACESAIKFSLENLI